MVSFKAPAGPINLFANPEDDPNLERSAQEREVYFEEIASNPTLAAQEHNNDDVYRIAVNSGNEGTVNDVREQASATGDELGKDTSLEVLADKLESRYGGSINVNLSESAQLREDSQYLNADRIKKNDSDYLLFHVLGNDVSAKAATIGGVVYPIMLEAGVDQTSLDRALAAGGTMETPGQLRNTLNAFYDIARTNPGLSGLMGFMAEVDNDLFGMAKQSDPKADHAPVLGTPEKEPEAPTVAFTPPQYTAPGSQPGLGNGPNRAPGMA